MDSSNVLDVLDSLEGKKMIESVADFLKRDWKGMGEDFVISTVISYLTGASNPLCSGLTALYTTQYKLLLKLFTAEQVNYLISHSWELKKQLEINLFVSVRLLTWAFQFKDIMNISSFGRLVFNSITNWSVEEAFADEVIRKIENDYRLMWQVLSFSLSIVLNLHINYKVISREIAENWVSQILNLGKSAHGCKELCFETCPPPFRLKNY